jgi:hypothetical protein
MRGTGGERAVGKSGAALIAHKLAAERADSTEYVDKYKKFYKTAYAGLPNGHADGNLNLFWGFVAAGAMEDDAILRTVMDYFKPWINMSRCFDGSFVVQPNRHAGDDDAYYHSSRYNPTASMALAFAMGSPKLMIQGIQVSIPGVNPKALRGTLAAAYKSIVGKTYGDAARAIKSAGPEDAATAAAMSEYLDSQARRLLDPLGLLEKSGHWVQLKDRIERERKAYAGIAPFDDAVRAWDAAMLGKTGSAILAADKAIVEGHYGRAQAALLPALSSTEDARLGSIAQAVAARIAVAAKETVARWSALETSGEWHTLRKELDTQAERWRGIAAVEEKSKALDASLKPDTGRALVDAHRLLLDDAFGPALAAVAPALADTSPAGTSSAARALQARVQAAAEKALGTLEAMEKDGRWQSLRDSVAKAKPKMAGFKAFEERNKAWEEGFATTSGRALIASDQQALQGFLGNAWRALDPALAAQDARATAAKKRIEESVKAQLAPLAELETKGDWYRLERGLSALRRKLAGIPAFDEKDAAWQAAFKSDPAKSSIRLGATLQQLREAVARSPSKALIKEVEAFVQQAGDNTFYGREAKSLLDTLRR